MSKTQATVQYASVLGYEVALRRLSIIKAYMWVTRTVSQVTKNSILCCSMADQYLAMGKQIKQSLQNHMKPQQRRRIYSGLLLAGKVGV
jgi:hypothetical protein